MGFSHIKGETKMKKLVSVIVLALIAVIAMGCTVESPVEDLSIDCRSTVVVEDTGRDEDGNLFYGTSNYPEGRREAMEAAYNALNG